MSGKLGALPWETKGAFKTSLRLTVAATMLVAFLFSRAALMQELHPFGPSLVVFLGVFNPSLIWPAVLAAIAGSYRGVWGSFISNGAVFILLGMVLTFYP